MNVNKPDLIPAEAPDEKRPSVPRYAPLAGLAVAVVLISALVFSVHQPKAAAPPAPSAPPAVSLPPTPKEISVTGRVEAVHTIPVSVSIAGEVDSFSAEVGQDVFEGQVLARIANRGLETGRDSLQRALQASEQKLSTLETTISAARLEAVRAHDDSVRAQEEMGRTTKAYERQKLLAAAGATPRNTYEKSQKDMEAAQNDSEGTRDLAKRADEHVQDLTKQYDALKKTIEDKRKELEEAQAALAATEVHAPAGGVVVARQGEIGKPLTQEEAAALFRIATDLSALEAVFPPDTAMKKGDSVTVSFSDIPGDPMQGVIRDIKDGEARADFTSANPAIRPGMPCTVQLTARK
jgi:multidrug efflux pump subunit AcrA (membrane-fusion protein)